jgi:NADPH:quinone reductase-like Zn-dependent oxidoreductase
MSPFRGRENGRVKAVVFDRYGPPDVLRVEEVETPVPKEDELLVRVHATTVTRTDTGFRSAEYFVSRFFTGIRRPRPNKRILGSEFAGEVEAIGAAVAEFNVGDRVFGLRSGAHAEYVCVRENGVVTRMPAGMTFEEAAAVADGALTALSGLKKVGLGPGRSILVYGASGSIGTASVQLAKYFAAHVTAVCNTQNVELMSSLGADEVIDYLQDDFTKNGKTYDVIFDAVGKQTYMRSRRSLKSGGSSTQIPDSCGTSCPSLCGRGGSATRRQSS